MAALSASPSSLVVRASVALFAHGHCLRVTGISKTSSSLVAASWAPSPRSSSVVAFARRRKGGGAATTTRRKPSQLKESSLHKDDEEDAIEALFSQLEEDLKNDNLLEDEDDEITEEDLSRLEQELEEVLGDGDYVDVPEALSSSSDNLERDGESDNDEEERRPALKRWQLRRLACALKIGRRKTSIKSLAEDLGLERTLVLELLRDPPPNLLLLSASLPDEVPQTSEAESSTLPDEVTQKAEEGEPPESPLSVAVNGKENKHDVKLPIHVMRKSWSMQKRLKKVQVETLEKVYSRTKRPTNAMISSVVHVTKLPWKIVVKWFEDKRLQDGVPEHRVPFRRSIPETISTS